MIAQGSLFDPAPARYLDPDTSHKAARSFDSETATGAVIEAHRTADGLTDDEMCAQITDDYRRWPTLKSARSRLSNARRLLDSGKRRPSERGREQIVWRLP